MAEQFPDAQISERTLSRIYSGETDRPWVPTAYELGWALHDIGIDWCSGPVVLCAAGFYEEFFKLLGFLATCGSDGYCAALRFAYASERAGAALTTIYDGVALDEECLARFSVDEREKLIDRRNNDLAALEREQRRSREHLQSAATLRQLIKSSWDTSRSRKLLFDVPEAFQLAVDVVSSSKCAATVRYDGALAVLSSFTRLHGTFVEQQLVRELTLLSSIRTIDDIAEDLLQNWEFMDAKVRESIEDSRSKNREFLR